LEQVWRVAQLGFEEEGVCVVFIWPVALAGTISSAGQNAVPPALNWAAIVAALLALAGVIYRTVKEGRLKRELQAEQANLTQELRDRVEAFEHEQQRLRQAFEREMKDREYATQARLAQQAELIKPRLEAYQKLWSIMENASVSTVQKKKIELTPEKREEMENRLRAWYFSEGGNGIFLSNKARDLFIEAQDQLMALKPGDVVDTLSKLRTQTKNELGVYGLWEDDEKQQQTGKR
jgi:hypothetical protein